MLRESAADSLTDALDCGIAVEGKPEPRHPAPLRLSQRAHMSKGGNLSLQSLCT